MPSAFARSPHTTNAYFHADSLIELMHAGREPAARHRRRRAPWIGHRGGERAALLPAVGHPPPRPARGRDRRAAAAARRPRDPAHPPPAAAGAELSAHVGLTAGRVRMAAFASAIGSLVPAAVAALAGRHPNLQISLTETHPPEAIELLRTGKIEGAIIFRS